MKIEDLYKEAVLLNHPPLLLLFDFLLFEKEVLKMNDPADKLNYFLQDKFKDAMRAHLKKYKEKRDAVRREQ